MTARQRDRSAAAQVIDYTPGGLPVTEQTPLCLYAGCGQPGVHGGLCGPHWWQESAWDGGIKASLHGPYDPPVVARCIAAIVADGAEVTLAQLVEKLLSQWQERWTSINRLRASCRAVLTAACRKGAAAADHNVQVFTIVSVGRLARCCDD